MYFSKNLSLLYGMWEIDHISELENITIYLNHLIVEVPKEYISEESYKIRVKVDNLTFYRSIKCEGNKKYQYIVVTHYLAKILKNAKTMQIIFDNYEEEKQITKEYIIEGFETF
ncbi:MAG: hypothetical protein ACRC0G_15200 [Fusobacteriaceae bacterium]